MPCRSDPGGWVSQHALQVSPGDVWSGGGVLQFFRGVSNFSGGSPIVWEGSPIFQGGGVWLRRGLRGEVKGG